MNDYDEVDRDFDPDDDSTCPVHKTAIRKVYTFGSRRSAETEVCVFKGCKCAVAIWHDPIGGILTKATYHTTFASAGGVGKLRASDWAVKLKD